MLRQLFVFPALAVVAATLAVPAMASEITGDVSVSANLYFTNNGGAFSFLANNAPSVRSFSSLAAPLASSGAVLTLSNNFVYDNNISPAIFTTTIGGQTGTLTLNSITGQESRSDGVEVFLTGTFDQAGYAQELATASFLINSDYIGNNVNLMMLRGIAQLTPPPTPEPASIALLGTGILGMAGFVRRRMVKRHEVPDAD